MRSNCRGSVSQFDNDNVDTQRTARAFEERGPRRDSETTPEHERQTDGLRRQEVDLAASLESTHHRHQLTHVGQAIGTHVGRPVCGQRDGGGSKMAVHYVEIVTNDVDAVAQLYERTHGLSFAPPDPDLGQARVATPADGPLVGIRAPLAAHEQPIIRTYLAVEDIQLAVKKAEDAGAEIAYPPTIQGQRSTFSIVIQGDVQHGLWQR